MYFDISGSFSIDFGRRRPSDPVLTDLQAQIERADDDDEPTNRIGFQANPKGD